MRIDWAIGSAAVLVTCIADSVNVVVLGCFGRLWH